MGRSKPGEENSSQNILLSIQSGYEPSNSEIYPPTKHGTISLTEEHVKLFQQPEITVSILPRTVALNQPQSQC